MSEHSELHQKPAVLMLAFKLKTRSAIKNKLIRLYEFAVLSMCSVRQPVMPDDHSKLVPLLPIPNRTVKRLSADDSADARVKVGHRQALIKTKRPMPAQCWCRAFRSLERARSVSML